MDHSRIARASRPRPIHTALLVGTLAATLTGCGFGDDSPVPTATPNDLFVIVTPTPGTPVPKPTDDARAPRSYIVRPGDNLSGIATRFGVSLSAIQKANDISDPDSIYAGQELIIPPVEPS